MANENITKQDLDKVEENLGRMINKSFDENNKQHQETLEVLNKHGVMLVDHTERLNRVETRLDGMDTRLDRIETKLDGIVYRKEFEELLTRVQVLEKTSAIKK